jgi:hypothetical protein
MQYMTYHQSAATDPPLLVLVKKFK